MNKKKHLTNAERIKIETLLSQGFSIRSIADFLEKSPSTISREIGRHSIVKTPNTCDCNDYTGCNVKHICGSKDCNKKCLSFHLAKKYCEHYSKRSCEHWNGSKVKLCNGCTKRGYCRLEKHFYDAKKAQAEYCDTLIQSRNGFDLTLEDMTRINSIISPRIKKGQSLYHIAKNNGDELNISESTLRRLVMAGEMDAGLIDLPQAVKRRKRKVRIVPKLKNPKKTGHLYSDFKKYLSENDVPVVQMDCIVGKKEDSRVLLTLHFTQFHMQLIFRLKEHTSKCVTDLFDSLEKKLGKELFAMCFPLILTDNGHEFSNIDGMEKSIYGGKRTNIFFCDPNRSDQKGQCENNHKLIRTILPKGTSFSRLTNKDTLLVTNHINSYVRKSLFGKSPFETAMNALPAEFFTKLKLKRINESDVNLTPKLLKH